MVQSCSNVLDSLMQQFRDYAAHDTVVYVHHMGKNSSFKPLLIIDDPGVVEDLDFRDMYADGASCDTSKLCLSGTREAFCPRSRTGSTTPERTCGASFGCLAPQEKANQPSPIQ
jgi:hypothetical protein